MDALSADDPRKIGDYLLSGRLGAAGWARCSLAGHQAAGQSQSKLFTPYLLIMPSSAAFSSEVEAGRKVGGFHAAQVVDADPDGVRPWMVTAYIAGPSLSQVLAQHHALPVQSVRVLGNGLAEALAAIHAAGSSTGT